METIAFWNALASAPASCLHRLVLIDNLQDASLYGVHNFSWSVSHCLCSVGYDLPIQVQSIPVIDANTVIAGLEQMSHMCMCAGNLLQIMTYLESSTKLSITTSPCRQEHCCYYLDLAQYVHSTSMQSTRGRHKCDMLVIAPTVHLLAGKP